MADYTTFLNANYDPVKSARWSGMPYENPYTRTRTLPTKTITDMVRTLGGYQNPALTALQQQRYAGFRKPSTCFSRVFYNPDTRLAQYTFNGGNTYYKLLSPVQAQRWANSPSLGKYYNAFVRMRLNNSPLGKLFFG